MNPDLKAAHHLKSLLENFTWEYPDGEEGRFHQIDVGYFSRPSGYPYAAIHSAKSSAPVVRLGMGAGTLARRFEIELVLTIEYEDPDPQRGYERLTTLRWEVFRHLVLNAQAIPGVEFTDLDEATIEAVTEDDGGFERWGFYGMVLIPIKVVLNPQ
ncbi:hypothetical protein [Thermus phage P23-45]|uniref:Uncharacterized protein n=1 Tax=Thermus virus P23-45 TaxID=2914006 RepID=A7XXC7_BP234|nr:hypothetical protein P23p93 [Thermus phage P23-45]ABU96926.1 hypothetical protein P23p93 [Thermus phage P23-45]UYB98498.1 hypothetical protein [Thermus phage P23-45]